MQQNLQTYNNYTHEYKDYHLYPAEQIIFGKFEDKWSDFRMLDIGIGTGRTTYHFSPLVKHYTGIDYAEMMVQKCREKIKVTENVILEQADARDLSKYYNDKFDFIMFTLNGIDSVSHEDRKNILQEIRKVLTKDGHFYFSSHSLRAFRNYREPPKFKWYSPAKSILQIVKTKMFNRRIKSFYSDKQVQSFSGSDWKILKTGAHDFNIDIHHIDPSYQLKQLNEIGFDVVSIYGLYGGIQDVKTTKCNTLYYLCKMKPDKN